MGFTYFMQMIPPMYLFLCCVGVCLSKIYQLQPPGKINLSGHSEIRLQILSQMRHPFREISGLLSTREFICCLSSEQITIYSCETGAESERREKHPELYLYSMTALILQELPEHQGCINNKPKFWQATDGGPYMMVDAKNKYIISNSILS